MAFVQAKCENCGGFLKVDDRKRAANCPYCGAAYVVQDAINYYHNVINTNDLHISLPNMEYLPPWKTKLDAAEGFLRLKEYDKALSIYVDLKEVIPQEYRVWWGQVRSITKDFTEIILDWDQLNTLYLLFRNATLFVSQKDSGYINQQFFSYYSTQEQHIREKISELELQREQLSEEKHQLKMCMKECKAKKSPNLDQISGCADIAIAVLMIVGILSMSFSLIILDLIGIGIYASLVYPELKKNIKDEEAKKKKAIREFSERQKEIENELSQIESQLEHLRDPAEGQL